TINCLNGISRQTIIQLAQQMEIPIEECRLLPYDVTTADEAFFTSTPYCIMPATKFNGITIGSGEVGPITKKLIGAWSQLVGVDIQEQAQQSLS
ncbi:MAG: aminotransferase class IV, partial [Planctomycetaceae bacterium]|nr:aminotransferase class IV [Planctomycetaceae bacterium]